MRLTLRRSRLRRSCTALIIPLLILPCLKRGPQGKLLGLRHPQLLDHHHLAEGEAVHAEEAEEEAVAAAVEAEAE